MDKKYYAFLSELFPFRGLREKQLDAIFESVSVLIEQFSRDSVIYSPESYERKIGFVVKGECAVLRERSDGGSITLNTLGRHASFGIMAILSQKDEYPTVIRATRAAEVMFIDGDDFLAIIKKYPTVAMNVMRFLAERVTFLNERINTFSEKSTEARLANRLLKRYSAEGAILAVSKSKLAGEIDVGRASLYRDLEALVERGIIEVEQKRIIIKDPKGLERMIK